MAFVSNRFSPAGNLRHSCALLRSVTHVSCDLTPVRAVGVGADPMDLLAREVLGFTPFPHFQREEPRQPTMQAPIEWRQ